MNYWLLKTEPDEFSYHDLSNAPHDVWDGVRNVQARKNMKEMEPGDLAFIYHTGKEKSIIGVAEITSDPFPDPGDPKFTAVHVQSRYLLPRPVSLAEIKAAPQFAGWALVRQPRLSVMPVTTGHWQAIHTMAKET
ncbi:MAG: EVE domain-containing protein [Clostridiales bacterium]|nr:EVE domain-containing protein [Clostridiales bacterium]